MFKRLYKTIIREPPAIDIVDQTTSTQHKKHARAPPAMPTFNINGPIELALDPALPGSLIDRLDQFTNSLEESQLDDDFLGNAEQVVNLLRWLPRTFTIRNETSVFLAFTGTIVVPVRLLCGVIGVNADYRSGPRVLHLNQDYAWTDKNQPVIIFEHITPPVFDLQSTLIVSMARRRQTLDLGLTSTDAETSIAKLILVSLVKGFKYCVLHSSTSFLVIHLVQNTQGGRHQARVSNVIPLTSPTTPIVALILALILHSKRDGQALEYQSLERNFATRSDEKGRAGESSPPNAMLRDPAEQQGEASSSNHSNCNQAPFSEYWEPEVISGSTLSALLETANGRNNIILGHGALI
ncbi:hypothetical protein FRC01_008631 [Tulasnella sp. 417]|nr:hypothetical protein FRC01_008631 [Tulasnella sp. 417]